MTCPTEPLLRVPIALAVLLCAALSCADPSNPNCTDEGAHFEISPSPVNVDVGRSNRITVVAVWCSGHRREEVYPTMSSGNSSIASVSNTYRTVRGQAPGTTVLSVVDDEG